MTFDDLKEFIKYQESNGDLVRVNEEVDPELELTYILSEEERIGKKRTMLFNNVKGSKMPVIGNIFSSDKKIEAILGDTPYNIGLKLKNLVRIPDDTESMISRGLAPYIFVFGTSYLNSALWAQAFLCGHNTQHL